MRLPTIIVRPIIPAGRETKKPRDWAAISISVLSLIVSCLSFYFTTLLQTDDIRVVIDGAPYLSADDDGSLLIEGQVKLTWVNSGNRTAAILSVAAIGRKLGEGERVNPKCEGENWNGFELGFEPFVLKPGEIISQHSKGLFGLGISPTKRMGREAYKMRKEFYIPKANDTLLVCIVTKIVTPDDYMMDWSTAVYRYTFDEKTIELSDDKGKPIEFHLMTAEPNPLFDKARPMSLVGQNRWLEKLRSAFGIKK